MHGNAHPSDGRAVPLRHDDEPMLLLGRIDGKLDAVAGDVSNLLIQARITNGRVNKAEKDIEGVLRWQTDHDAAARAAADRRKERRNSVYKVCGALLSAGVLGHLSGAWQWAAHAMGLAR